jgi:hypothetical protein
MANKARPRQMAAIGVVGILMAKAAISLSSAVRMRRLHPVQLSVGSNDADAVKQRAKSERDVERDAWRDLLAEMAKQLPLAGLVVFIVLRALYARFYEQFGLVPEDVGLTYVDILAKSGLLLLTLATVVFVAGLATFHRRSETRRQAFRAAMGGFVLGAGLLLSVILPLARLIDRHRVDSLLASHFANAWWLDRWTNAVTPFGGTVIEILVFLWLGLLLVLSVRRLTHRPRNVAPGTFGLMTAATLSTAVMRAVVTRSSVFPSQARLALLTNLLLWIGILLALVIWRLMRRRLNIAALGAFGLVTTLTLLAGAMWFVASEAPVVPGEWWINFSGPKTDPVTLRAERVQAGLAASPVTLGPLTVVDLRAEPVKVEWAGPPPSPPSLSALFSSSCVVLLGQTGSYITLAVPGDLHAQRGSQTIRVAPNLLTITNVPPEERCR